VYSAAIPQRAYMVLERCTNPVASPFGVTGALPTDHSARGYNSYQQMRFSSKQNNAYIYKLHIVENDHTNNLIFII